MQANSAREQDSPAASGWWFFRTAIVQGILFLSLLFIAMLGNPTDFLKAVQSALVSYVVVYLYGLAALTLFASSVRAITEHQIGPDQGTTVNSAALRNFAAGPLAIAVLGTYGFKDHATHHSDPAIPYYRLAARTQELASIDTMFEPRFQYGSVLLSLIKR